MHIQLRQSGLLMRNITIYGICTTFLYKLRKTETKLLGADSMLVLLTMFCQIITESRIRSDWTQNLGVETGRWMSLIGVYDVI